MRNVVYIHAREHPFLVRRQKRARNCIAEAPGNQIAKETV